jgi:hypothetical protein
MLADCLGQIPEGAEPATRCPTDPPGKFSFGNLTVGVGVNGLESFTKSHRTAKFSVLSTQEAKQALMTDQQLADRFEAWELPPWQDDPALLQLLASFAAILPLRRASELRDPKIRNRVLVLTEGVTVRICRLLEAAAIQAIEKEHELINLQMLTDDLTTETLVSISDRRSRRTN